jgi:NDP-sugar pyrophosphorylase family protein
VSGPCFIDAGVHVKAGATIGGYSVLGRGVLVEESADLQDTIVWPTRASARTRSCTGRSSAATATSVATPC